MVTLVETTFKTPFGPLKVVHDTYSVLSAQFETTPSGVPASRSGTTSFCDNVAKALNAYVKNKNHRFQLTLAPKGTPFQQRVWHALLAVPSGRTLTYGELAVQLQTSPRAIGQACKRNPIALFIPCHRIIGQASLGGYMGALPDLCSIKKQLLNHES